MSEDRLDKGFVTWQGQRVFVPWFGAPRIVSRPEDEVRILKLKFRMHFVMAAALIGAALIGLFVALWFQEGTVAASAQAKSADLEVVVSLALAISLVFGCGALLEYRHYRTWPPLFNASFAHERFMLAYFRTLRLWPRVSALGWSVAGLILCLPAFGQMMPQQVEDFGDDWFLLKIVVALLGPGILGFLALRHTGIALASLFLLPRALPNNSSST